MKLNPNSTVESGADKNLIPKSGFGTPLYTAVADRQYEVVEYLLGIGANPNIVRLDHYSPLSMAVLASTKKTTIHPDDLRMIQMLLERGADPNLTGFKSPIHIAVEANSLTILNILLNAGGDPNLQYNGWGPLHDAVTASIGITMRLLEAGADPNAVSSNGTTPLMGAAMNNRDDIIKALFEKKADPNLKNVYGKSALALAASSGAIESVKLILGHDAVITEDVAKGAYNKKYKPEINELILERYAMQRRGPFAAMYHYSNTQKKRREYYEKQMKRATEEEAASAPKNNYSPSEASAAAGGPGNSNVAGMAGPETVRKLGGAYKRNTRRVNTRKNRTRKHKWAQVRKH